MRCTECQSQDLRRGDVPVSLTLPMRTADGHSGERDFEGTVAGTTCGRCGATTYDGPDLGRFERLVALRLLHLGISTGTEVRFLRKKAGFTAVELARHLGVTAETVSHWEAGKKRPDHSTLAMIVQLARAELERDAQIRRLLQAEPAPAPKDLLERLRCPELTTKVSVGSTSTLDAA